MFFMGHTISLFLRILHPAVYHTISRIRQGGALYSGYAKYFELYHLLRRFRPKKILEFDSGSSTAVFACYAHRTGASVCTVEHDQKWLENTREAIGEFANRVNFLLSPVIKEAGSPNHCSFRDIPSGEFDFVYVDGPPTVGWDVVNWNIVDMIRAGKTPRYIVVDGRVPTTCYIVTHFLEEYEPFLNLFLNGRGKLLVKVFPGYKNHSYFIKRSESG